MLYCLANLRHHALEAHTLVQTLGHRRKEPIEVGERHPRLTGRIIERLEVQSADRMVDLGDCVRDLLRICRFPSQAEIRIEVDGGRQRVWIAQSSACKRQGVKRIGYPNRHGHSSRCHGKCKRLRSFPSPTGQLVTL